MSGQNRWKSTGGDYSRCRFRDLDKLSQILTRAFNEMLDLVGVCLPLLNQPSRFVDRTLCSGSNDSLC